MSVSTNRLLTAAFIAAISCTTALAADLPNISIGEDGITVGGISVSTEGVVIKGTSTETLEGASGTTNVFNGDYTRSNFSGQNLSGARFVNSKFTRAKFDGANLKGAIFENSDFTQASFVGACMQGVKFINSNLTRADMTGAVLTDMSNTRSNFSRAKMKNVDRNAACGQDNESAGQEIEQDASASSRVEVTNAQSIVVALSKGVDSSVSLTVNFATNSDQLDGKALTQIREISTALSSPDLSGTAVLIEGHTDSVGKSNYNLDLSFRRAAQVKRILVTEYGVDANLIAVSGFGEAQPIANNGTSNGRALNRRVTLVNKGIQRIE